MDERYTACYEKHRMSFTRDWTLQEMVYQHTATEGTKQGNCTVINCKRTNEGLIRVSTGKETEKKETEFKGMVDDMGVPSWVKTTKLQKLSELQAQEISKKTNPTLNIAA